LIDEQEQWMAREDKWRKDGEEYAQVASRQAPDDPVVQALLAIYCEIRHANDGGGEISQGLQDVMKAVNRER
jgi:hypothetical protein